MTNIDTYQTSFKWAVIWSIYSEQAGPIPSTVLDPALICVCPASSTIYIFIPISKFSNFFLIKSISVQVQALTTTFGVPCIFQLCSLILDRSSNLASYYICKQVPITACPTCAHTFPLPIFNYPLMTNNIFVLDFVKCNIENIPLLFYSFNLGFAITKLERSAYGPSSQSFKIIQVAFSMSFVRLIAFYMQERLKPSSFNSQDNLYFCQSFILFSIFYKVTIF